MATIRKRSGKWQVQIRRQGQPPLSRTFTYQADATAWARSIEAKQDRSDGVVDTRPLRTLTVDNLLQRYATTVSVAKRGAAVEVIRINCLRRTELANLSLGRLEFSKLAPATIPHLRLSTPRMMHFCWIVLQWRYPWSSL